MTTYSILMVLWIAASIALLVWSTMKRGRLVSGGLALGALSLVPMPYGRWTTPSEWHDSPLMAVYYVPTLLALALSIIIIVVGFVVKLRQALLHRRGA